MPARDRERDLVLQVAERLSSLGVNLETEVAIPKSGVRADLVGTTPKGTKFVIDVKGETRSRKDLAEVVRRQIQISSGHIKSDRVFVVAPHLQSSDKKPDFILSLDELETQVNLLLIAEGLIGSRKRKSPGTIVDRSKVGPPTVFTAMPFTPKLEDTYQVAIRGAAAEAGIVAYRIDQDTFTDLIIVQIQSKIKEAVGIVADLTDANPNVLYELGYAHALKKPAVLISSGEIKKLPFDVQNWGVIAYSLGQTHSLKGKLVTPFEEHFTGKKRGAGD